MRANPSKLIDFATSSASPPAAHPSVTGVPMIINWQWERPRLRQLTAAAMKEMEPLVELHRRDPLDGDEGAGMCWSRDRPRPLDRCATKSLCRIVALPSTEAPAGSVPCGVAAEHLAGRTRGNRMASKRMQSKKLFWLNPPWVALLSTAASVRWLDLKKSKCKWAKK